MLEWMAGGTAADTQTTNHSSINGFVTEISAWRISTVSDCSHTYEIFSVCVCVSVAAMCIINSKLGWWYSRLPAVLSPENKQCVSCVSRTGKADCSFTNTKLGHR